MAVSVFVAWVSSCTHCEVAMNPMTAGHAPTLGAAEVRALEQLVVLIYGMPGNLYHGSAVKLGGSRLLTCAHLLPDTVQGKSEGTDMPTEAGAAGVTGMVNHRLVRYRVLSAGCPEPMEDDWAIIEVPDGSAGDLNPESSDYEVRFDSTIELNPGQPVFLVGFWNPDAGEPERSAIVRACVVDPGRIEIPPEMIPVQAPSKEEYGGLSGGAAAILDVEHKRITVVGVYRGMRIPEWMGIQWRGVHTIRRVPKEHVPVAPRP
jgi:hypothetical protein